jgi:hypothetical protein
MGLLDGEISALFGTVFGGLYLNGTLTRVTIVPDGEGGGSSTETTQPCKVQIDACTEVMRAAPGYGDEDVRLLILQASVTTGGPINSDCSVTPATGRHAGRKFDLHAPITEDPASSYWECRATPAK